MDSVTFSDPLIASISKSMVFAKINADADTMLAKMYGVSGFPTMIIAKPNGVELDRLVGYYPPSDFLPALFDLLQNRNTLDYLLSRAILYRDSIALLFDIAQNYTYRSDNGRAAYYYRQIMEKDANNEKGFNDDCWMELASLKRKDGKVGEAVKMYAEMAAKFPGSELIEEAQLMIPYSYHKSGDLRNAEKYYRKFKKDYPESKNLEWIDKQLEKIIEEKKK